MHQQTKTQTTRNTTRTKSEKTWNNWKTLYFCFALLFSTSSNAQTHNKRTKENRRLRCNRGLRLAAEWSDVDGDAPRSPRRHSAFSFEGKATKPKDAFSLRNEEQGQQQPQSRPKWRKNEFLMSHRDFWIDFLAQNDDRAEVYWSSLPKLWLHTHRRQPSGSGEWPRNGGVVLFVFVAASLFLLSSTRCYKRYTRLKRQRRAWCCSFGIGVFGLWINLEWWFIMCLRDLKAICKVLFCIIHDENWRFCKLDFCYASASRPLYDSISKLNSKLLSWRGDVSPGITNSHRTKAMKGKRLGVTSKQTTNKMNTCKNQTDFTCFYVFFVKK